MAREQWFIDGYELTQGTVRDVEYRTGLYGTPAPVGDNLTVPGVTGERWVPKVHGPGAFTLALWLGDRTSRQAVEALHADLLRAAARTRDRPLWTRVLADGTSRLCYAEVRSSLAADPVGQRAMRVSIECSVPEGYWHGIAVPTHTSVVGTGATGTDLTLTSHADSTAPLERLAAKVFGPITAPRVVDRTLGVDGPGWFYNGTIPNGAWLNVDADTWTVTSSGFVHDLGLLTTTAARWLQVGPAKPGGTPKVALRGSALGAATKLTITGRSAYLC